MTVSSTQPPATTTENDTLDSRLLYAVNVDSVSRTMSPVSLDGDEYFGLALGTNGTAAICRRTLIARAGYTWLRHDGSIAHNVNLLPGAVLE